MAGSQSGRKYDHWSGGQISVWTDRRPSAVLVRTDLDISGSGLSCGCQGSYSGFDPRPERQCEFRVTSSTAGDT